MIARRIGFAAIAFGLSACASQDDLGFAGQRTVFSSPYVPPVIDRGMIGPACDETRARGSVCTAGAIVYPGRGRHALLPNGDVVRLTRAERRILRERAEARKAQADVFESLAKGTPLPPASPAMPTSPKQPPIPASGAARERETP